MSPQTEIQPSRPLATEPSVHVAAAPVLPKVARIVALDFTKGTLVLLMVLYHWLNYFTNFQWREYKYLHFLTPSFIFITGFMISHIYLSKYDPADSSLPRRLFSRAFKLMAVFIFLNTARVLLLHLSRPVISYFFDMRNLSTIFVLGNLPVVGGKLVSFFILVPICYLLALSGVLMRVYRSFPYTFHLMCAILLLSILMLRMIGMESTNLELITIGLCGVLAGFVSLDTINRFVGHSILLTVAYSCYLAAITVGDVPFPLLVIGVVLTLMIIYRIGCLVGRSGTASKEVVLLGKYSLLGYIAQIAILQTLSVVSRHRVLGPAWLTASFLAAFVFTIASVEVTDRARVKVASLDKLYKAIFA